MGRFSVGTRHWDGKLSQCALYNIVIIIDNCETRHFLVIKSVN